MRQPAVTVCASASLVATAKLMRERDVGFVAVIESGALVGVVTDRDIVLRSVSLNGRANDVLVADVMSRHVLTCLESQTVENAAASMGDNQVRRLPVLDETGNLVGVLSLDAIAEDYSESLAGETLGEIVEERSPPPNVAP
ncbi:MAG: CBS domain-containing protein [Hoeflea sp. D1-CHI-28]